MSNIFDIGYLTNNTQKSADLSYRDKAVLTYFALFVMAVVSFAILSNCDGDFGRIGAINAAIKARYDEAVLRSMQGRSLEHITIIGVSPKSHDLLSIRYIFGEGDGNINRQRAYVPLWSSKGRSIAIWCSQVWIGEIARQPLGCGDEVVSKLQFPSGCVTNIPPPKEYKKASYLSIVCGFTRNINGLDRHNGSLNLNQSVARSNCQFLRPVGLILGLGAQFVCISSLFFEFSKLLLIKVDQLASLFPASLHLGQLTVNSPESAISDDCVSNSRNHNENRANNISLSVSRTFPKPLPPTHFQSSILLLLGLLLIAVVDLCALYIYISRPATTWNIGYSLSDSE